MPKGVMIYKSTEDNDVANADNNLTSRRRVSVDISSTAAHLVHSILDQSVGIIESIYAGETVKPYELLVYEPANKSYEKLNDFPAYISVKAIPLLTNYIRCWSLQNRPWKYLVKLFKYWPHDDTGVHTFIFEAVFSVPTRQQPTPQCTASVFFQFYVPSIDRHTTTEPVQVSYRYQFEGMTYFYAPSDGQLNFQQDILLQILENKLRLYKTLDF